MSHTNQTANYHLPQFIGTDKPAWLVDVNGAMADIDTQMKANETAAATAEADAQSALSGVTALNSQVGSIQTSVTTLETQAPLDEAQIETNRQNIATNAQNIVDLDNRMGHTSISGIGDGSATGAIKAVDDKVGDLADLDTTDKSSIVDAINEVVAGGGDASTVRYYNGYIQYTPDGGTTWVNLINTATPQQLLPIMTSNVNAFGEASCLGRGASAIGANEAYLLIDGTSPTTEGQFGEVDDYIEFEFTDSQYVKTISFYARGLNYSGNVVDIEYTTDGVTWYNASSVTLGTSSLQYSSTINTTIKAFRLKLSTMVASYTLISRIEAWN